MIQSNPSTVVSLAILKVFWDRNQDFFDIFVPIVTECIRRADNDVITTPQVQDDLKQKFGLELPHNSIKTILRRVKQKGYLRQENNLYYRNQSKICQNESGFAQIQSQVVGFYESLVSRFIDFCRRKFSVDFDNDTAETAFQEYLKEHELALVVGSSSTTVIPDVENLSRGSNRFYVGAFVQYLQTDHPAEFEHWEQIVVGNMLANAVFLPNPNEVNMHFRNTSVFFDTSFLIYALGYAGPARQAPCTELLNLLDAAEAEMKCFRHTYEEIQGILSACKQRISSGQLQDAYGPSMEYFVQRQYKASDIELFILKLESDLERLRVKVENKPDYTSHAYVIDESELKSRLTREISYRDPDGLAVERDVDSISAIMRLRKGYQTTSIERCVAVFVSTNSGLANTARDFFSNQSSRETIAPVVTDYALTNMLWLKQPLRAPDLPRKRIIADLYAAMNPPENILRQFYLEIKHLSETGRITTEDYYLLRYSAEARNGLMWATRGGQDPVTDLTVREALEYAQDLILADERRKVQELQQKVEEEEEKERKRIENVKSRAFQVASWIVKLLRVFALFVLAVSTIVMSPWSFIHIKFNLLGIVTMILVVCVLVFGIYNMFYGASVNDYLKRLENELAVRIEKLIMYLSS